MPEVPSLIDTAASWPQIEAAAASPPEEVLDVLGTRASGLTSKEVAERAATFGPNAVRSHHASAWSVLARQLHSPLLWLLLAAATVSGVVGERLDAAIIGLIVAASVGLGFVNEFRAERAAEAMHSEIHHDVAATRDGQPVSVEVTHLVPGDIVHLGVGTTVKTATLTDGRISFEGPSARPASTAPTYSLTTPQPAHLARRVAAVAAVRQQALR